MESYSVRFVPIGGVVGVTKNMYAYELYRDNVLQDIVLVDCGVGFPKSTELGVDLIIPDITYLRDKLDKIRCLLLTHGHEDHIGAVPYLYEDLQQPPIYTSKLTAALVTNKLKEYTITPNITLVKLGQPYTFGGFKVTFIHTTHSIPDTCHIIIETPIGRLYHGQDYKMDMTPPYEDPPDFYAMAKAGKDGVLCLMSDALGAYREGLTLSESVVSNSFEDALRRSRGKFIMTTFASNVSRVRACIDAAIKFNRKVFFLGRSMVSTTQLAREIQYLPIPESLLGEEHEIMRLPPNKVCIICTGSQAQAGSALARIADNVHRTVKIRQGDTVLFSSDPIPGNEDEVYNIIEQLSQRGAQVIYGDVGEQLHASGHGNIDDLKMLMCLTKPKYMIPIGSTIRHHLGYQKIAEDVGYQKDRVFMLTEGETVVFTTGGKAQRGEVIETKNIYVDAYGVGDVGNVVLRDRQTLSAEGIVVAVVMISNRGHLVGVPKIVTRGFVYAKTETELLDQAAGVVQALVESRAHDTISDTTNVKKDITRELEHFFRTVTGRLPLVVVEVLVS